ncbi:DUF932 domain-containing protein [Thermodesulfobacteriota bacterium]
MSLLMHTGGDYVTLDDLRNVPPPEETETYKPVNHWDLSVNLQKVSQTILKDCELVNSQFGLARQGKQMFGVLSYRQGQNDHVGLSIGFRNSYDKSMCVGIAIGASVFVCDNLAFTGEISVMRRHTANVWPDLEELIITTIYRSRSNFHKIEEASNQMRSAPLVDDDAFRWLGLLFGRAVLRPRQLPLVKKEWLTPSYEAFEERNLWSFYNACTSALKSCTPNRIMEKHIELHEIFANHE